jgi:hypothetical protein
VPQPGHSDIPADAASQAGPGNGGYELAVNTAVNNLAVRVPDASASEVSIPLRE